MGRRRARIWAVVLLVWLCAGIGGDVRAQEEPAGAFEEIPLLEARTEEQTARIRERIDEISAVGRELEEAQARLDVADERSQELAEQKSELKRQIAEKREAYKAARDSYKEQVRAAYRGSDLAGLTGVLNGLLGREDVAAGFADPRVARILFEGRETLESYVDTRETLANMLRQISQKKSDYKAALAEERKQHRELRLAEEKLDEAIAELISRRERTKLRLQELREAEKAAILQTRSAAGEGDAGRSYELTLAREEIVAQPVDPVSWEEYETLYIQSAAEYGFAGNWHVLAAVGEVESNHGENMGPSTAGAMGPMQFLPSTWETSGVDGNGDGVANIMDPADAIPGAARYLQSGGAPDDWYRALYTYNHADWYVKKVLAVAEGYRRLANDHNVAPYI